MGSPLLTPLSILLCLLCKMTINARVVKEELNINRRCRVDLPSCFPTQLDWAKLEKDFSGQLVFPESSQNYTVFNAQYNRRVETYPLVHVMVRTAEDIRAAILFARRHNLRVTIKSSGSDFLGRSSAHSSFSINLMLMNDIEVNNGTTPRSEHGELKVQSGATWRDIYMEVDKYKRVIVGPGAQVVSPAGYTMGGGHSPLSPALGLAVDNVLEIQVVLADGRISTCTENQTVHVLPDGSTETENHGDLYWALRGGGGGTFAVVVHFVFRLHPAPESLVRVIIAMPFGDKNISGEIFKHYNSWTKRAPPSWGGYFTVDNYLTQWGQRGSASIYLVKLGKWEGEDEIKNDLQEFYELQRKLPNGTVQAFWITNHSSYWDIGKDLSGDYDPRYPIQYVTVGTLLPAERHNNDIGRFIFEEYMKDTNVPFTCHFSRLGGKVNDFDASSSSLHPGWRSALSCLSCNIGIEEGADRLETITKQERVKSSASGFAERLRRFGDGEYLNEADMDNSNWKLDYWSYHHDELLRIKVRYDPDGIFFCHHCVGSTLLYNYMESSSTRVAAGRLGIILAVVLFILANLLCV